LTPALDQAQHDIECFHQAMSKDWPGDPQTISPDQRRAEWLERSFRCDSSRATARIQRKRTNAGRRQRRRSAPAGSNGR
jgi:hypothetical protein